MTENKKRWEVRITRLLQGQVKKFIYKADDFDQLIENLAEEAYADDEILEFSVTQIGGVYGGGDECCENGAGGCCGGTAEKK